VPAAGGSQPQAALLEAVIRMEEARLNQSAWLESRLNQPGLTARVQHIVGCAVYPSHIVGSAVYPSHTSCMLLASLPLASATLK